MTSSAKNEFWVNCYIVAKSYYKIKINVMKTEYLKPEIEVLDVEPAAVLATSEWIDIDNTPGSPASPEHRGMWF